MNTGCVTPSPPSLRENARKLGISELCSIALIVVLAGALFGSVLVDMANDWWNFREPLAILTGIRRLGRCAGFGWGVRTFYSR